MSFAPQYPIPVSYTHLPETFTETAYQRLLKSMREIVSAAEKLGVTVGVEGVFDHTLYSPAMMKRFLEDIDSPNVCLLYTS